MAVRAVPQPLTQSNRGRGVEVSCLWSAHCLDDGADVGPGETAEAGDGEEAIGGVGRHWVSGYAFSCTVVRQT